MDLTIPLITLQGSSPHIWFNLSDSSYVDPGVTALDNYFGNISESVTISGSVDVTSVGTYTLEYNVTDACGNQAITKFRTVYVVDYTVINNIPVITISGDSSNNVMNTMDSVISSDYLYNDLILLQDEFSIEFSQANETYRIPTFNGMNGVTDISTNIVIFVYGFTNETITIVDTDMNNVANKLPYITDNTEYIRKMVNLVISNNNNYRLVVLNGRYNEFTSSILDGFDPSLTLLGPRTIDLSVNTEFSDPGASAQDIMGT